jgi:hypothetical protein
VTYEIRVLRSLGKIEGEPIKKTYSVIAMAAIALGSTSIATNASGADDPATPRSVADYTAPRWIGKAGPTSAPPSGQVATYKMNVEAGTAEYLGTKPTGDTATRAIEGPFNPPKSAGNFTLHPSRTPLAAYGFSGVGNKFGRWTDRGSFTSGNWRGYVGFAAGTRSPIVPPNSIVKFDRSATVTLVAITAKN